MDFNPKSTERVYIKRKYTRNIYHTYAKLAALFTAMMFFCLKNSRIARGCFQICLEETQTFGCSRKMSDAVTR